MVVLRSGPGTEARNIQIPRSLGLESGRVYCSPVGQLGCSMQGYQDNYTFPLQGVLL